MQEDNQIIAKSAAFIDLLKLAERVAASAASVLISGESGTGKEVLARYIHEKSPRANQPFVPLNCSAIPDQLLESELFGSAKGSFTGAINNRVGLFEEAQGGTLFLDEIGDMNIHLQAKLLRVLQERKLKRIGENYYRPINIRVIAATHNELFSEVEKGCFREDLYFRLNVIPLEIPPLRSRVDDILPLAEYFLQKFLKRNGSARMVFSEEVKEYLINHYWRGNVRELENLVERAVVLSKSGKINLSDVFSPIEQLKSPLRQNNAWLVGAPLMTLQELNQMYIEYVLNHHHGAKEQSAKILGIDRKTLYRWIQAPSQ